MTDRGREIRFNYDEQNDDDVDGVPMDESHDSRDRRNSRNSDNRTCDRDERHDGRRRDDDRRRDDRRDEDRRGDDRRGDDRRGDDRRGDDRRSDRRDRKDDYNRSDCRDRDGGRKHRPQYVNDERVDIPRLKTDDGREFYDMSDINDLRHKNMFRQRGEEYVDPSQAKVEEAIQRKIRDQAERHYSNRETKEEYADRILDAKPIPNWNESKSSHLSKKRSFADEVKSFDMRGLNSGAREGNH